MTAIRLLAFLLCTSQNKLCNWQNCLQNRLAQQQCQCPATSASSLSMAKSNLACTTIALCSASYRARFLFWHMHASRRSIALEQSVAPLHWAPCCRFPELCSIRTHVARSLTRVTLDLLGATAWPLLCANRLSAKHTACLLTSLAQSFAPNWQDLPLDAFFQKHSGQIQLIPIEWPAELEFKIAWNTFVQEAFTC